MKPAATGTARGFERWIGAAGRSPLARYAGTALVAVSPLLAVLFLVVAFGVQNLLVAVSRVQPGPLLLVASLSVALQILRAERARRLLSSGRTVSLGESYTPMVIGHGLGDMIPLAPGGPALRCVLTDRLARVPIPFSAGVFVVEGILDGLGLAVLCSFLLLSTKVPFSLPLVLAATVAPAVLTAGVLVAQRFFSPRFRVTGRITRQIGGLSRQVVSGLTSMLEQGGPATLMILGLSLAITLLSGVQIGLLLRAFGLTAAPADLLLVVVLTLATGSLPIKLPGSGTVTGAAILAMAGVHGAGTAGYLLVSRALFSSQATVLALMAIGWWSVSAYADRSGLLRALRPVAPRAEPVEVAGEPARRAFSGILSGATPPRLPAIHLPSWRALRESAISQGLLVVLLTVALRLIAAAISGGTFDPDEFVILALGRAVANGAVPYRDLTYYHPPGMLYLIAALQPLVREWWPISRAAILAVDGLTAALVWRLGRDLYDERAGLVAGLLYAVNPLSLVSAIRVGPDPVITALGMLGLVLLLRKAGSAGALLAGVCLGFAVWTKYPALLFLPVYTIAAPRRAWQVSLSLGLTLLALFAPFWSEAHLLYRDTVVWQLGHRGAADLIHRFGSVGGYWLCLNFLAVVGLTTRRHPLWLRAGFCAGAVFLFTAQAYYHYFVPIVPFAALLAVPVVRPWFDRSRRLVIVSALAASLLWALDLEFGPPPARLFVSASSLSSAQQTAALIDQVTPARSRILTDEFEYALLAHRGLTQDYFWNMQNSVSAQSLERQLSDTAAVVETAGIGQSYPPGFADYLEDRHFPHLRTRTATVWILSGKSAG